MVVEVAAEAEATHMMTETDTIDEIEGIIEIVIIVDALHPNRAMKVTSKSLFIVNVIFNSDC